MGSDPCRGGFNLVKEYGLRLSSRSFRYERLYGFSGDVGEREREKRRIFCYNSDTVINCWNNTIILARKIDTIDYSNMGSVNTILFIEIQRQREIKYSRYM